MDLEAKGRVILEVERRVESVKLDELAAAIGTPTAHETAALVPFFGPTIAGEGALVKGIGLDLKRALLGGQSYSWTRPFEPGETLKISVRVEDVFDKGPMRFGIIVTEFSDSQGVRIQEQKTTFLERRDS